MEENLPIIQVLEKILNEYADRNGNLNIKISFDADLSEPSKTLISYAVILNDILMNFSKNEAVLRSDLSNVGTPTANFENLMEILSLVTNMYALQALTSLAILDRKQTTVDPTSGHGSLKLLISNKL